jgi:hypothetical protein
MARANQLQKIKPNTMTNTQTQTKKTQKVRFYKFSTSATETPPFYIDDPKGFLLSKYTKQNRFNNDNLTKYGIYKRAGWLYDLKPYLKKYVVKQYDQWSESYAPNKTILRNVTYGTIQNIIEIK